MVQNNKKNIVLTGFMATGKTTVGKILAEKLNCKFIDTDLLIENKLNKKISDIFKDEGETFFRQYESKVIKDISNICDSVISCGGGVVLKKENIDFLRYNGIIVNLYASSQEILKRIGNNKDRPLLNNVSLEKIEKLIQERAKYYKNCDICIDTTVLSIEQIVKNLIDLKKNDTINNV